MVLAGQQPERTSFRTQRSSIRMASGLPHGLTLLAHGDVGGGAGDPSNSYHDGLHTKWGIVRDHEVNLRGAGQAGRNAGKCDLRDRSSYRHRNGQQWLRQQTDGRGDERRRAGGQRRRDLAFSSDEGQERVAALAAGIWDQRRRMVGIGENAGSGSRYREHERRDLPVVVHSEDGGTATGVVWDLKVQLGWRSIVQRRGDSIYGCGNTPKRCSQREAGDHLRALRQLRPANAEDHSGSEDRLEGRSIGDVVDGDAVRSAHHEYHRYFDELRNRVRGLNQQRGVIGAW